jgi:hypothetical protein
MGRWVMQRHEKRIVALSVAVTLLGGWVTMGEAEQAAMGPCNLVYVCSDEFCTMDADACLNEGQRLGCGGTLIGMSCSLLGNGMPCESNKYTLCIFN